VGKPHTQSINTVIIALAINWQFAAQAATVASSKSVQCRWV